jgi:hypothetical protein
MRSSKPHGVIIAILVALVLFGVLGKVTTAGYHCHYVRVGDSEVCQ